MWFYFVSNLLDNYFQISTFGTLWFSAWNKKPSLTRNLYHNLTLLTTRFCWGDQVLQDSAFKPFLIRGLNKTPIFRVLLPDYWFPQGINDFLVRLNQVYLRQGGLLLGEFMISLLWDRKPIHDIKDGPYFFFLSLR